MKFSVWPSPTVSPAEAIDTARWADANGMYGVWYADHYMPNTGDESIGLDLTGSYLAAFIPFTFAYLVAAGALIAAKKPRPPAERQTI